LAAESPRLNAARLIAGSLRLDASSTEAAGLVARAAEAGMDWEAVADHADAHTIAPLLYDVWRQSGALDRVPLPVRERLARAYADNSRRNAGIRADLQAAHRILEEAGVPHIVLKGWPLVERLYADPAHRFMSDQDFLVPAKQAVAGHRALRAAGYRPLPAKDEWIEKHLPSLWRNDGYCWDGYLYDPDYPRPVELHVRLWERGWRGLSVRDLDPESLWASARASQVIGLRMLVLSDEATLAHLAMHFAGHMVEREARLNQLLDLGRFVEQTGAGLDWDRCLAWAEAANIGRFVYASLWLARQIFGCPLPPDEAWRRLERASPPAWRAWLAAEAVEDTLASDYRRREKGKDYRLTFLAARSPGERLGILRFAAFPPLGQLAAKYRLRQPWLAPLLYPWHMAARIVEYGGLTPKLVKRKT
jgi:hypothetical protein